VREKENKLEKWERERKSARGEKKLKHGGGRGRVRQSKIKKIKK
jgi:hypothetical protein